jgi:hypothetical protein
MSTFKATLELDATGAITNLNDFEKQIKRGVMGSKELGETGAEAMESVAEETKAATRTLADIRKELKNVTNELAGVEDGSEAFTQLTQKAGALRNEIGDITAAINANAGPAVENLGNNFGNLQSSLTSLDFAGATRAAKGFSAQISQFNFAALTKGIGEFGKSLASLGRALLTNPIFLLAAAIGGIVAATMAWKEASLQVDSVLADNLAKQTELVNARRQELNDITGSTEQLKLQGKSQREILQLQRQKTAELIEDLKIQIEQQKIIKTQQVETAKRNKDILTGLLKFVYFPIQLILKAVDSAAKFLGKESDLANAFNDKITTFLFDPEEVGRNADATIKEQEDALKALIEQQARFQNQINDIDRTAADKRRAEQDKELADEKARQEKLAEMYRQAEQARIEERNQILLEIEKVEEDFRTSQLTEEQRALDALRTYFFELKTQAEAAGIDITEIERIEQQKRLEIEAEFAEKRRLAKEAEDQEELEKERALQDAKFQLAQNYAAAATSVNDALVASGAVSAEQGFRIGKALAASQTAINTLQGIVSAMAAPPIVPHAVKVKNAISIGVLGAANIAKILATKFGGGSAGSVRPSIGGGGGGAGSATQPATGIGGLQLTDIDNRPQQPRAYVIASDVTSQTEAAQKIADRARL